MAHAVKANQIEPWRRRLYVPIYRVGESARYAGTSTQTAVRWHMSDNSSVLSQRANGACFSYLQLIELAVVAAMRREGVKLRAIRAAREYFSKTLNSEFPFAEYRFKTDGSNLIVDYQQVDPSVGLGTLLYPNKGGQLGWKEILDRRLKEFFYEDNGIVIRWRVGGDHSSVFIDPRVSFGAPAVSGAATWAIKGRWEAGESVGDIALTQDQVLEALKFEGVQPDIYRQNLWAS